MSYKATRTFYERFQNRKRYDEGDEYNYQDENRIAYLLERGYLEEKSKQPPKQEKRTRKKASD